MDSRLRGNDTVMGLAERLQSPDQFIEMVDNRVRTQFLNRPVQKPEAYSNAWYASIFCCHHIVNRIPDIGCPSPATPFHHLENRRPRWFGIFLAQGIRAKDTAHAVCEVQVGK